MVSIAHSPQGFGLFNRVRNSLENVKTAQVRYGAFTRAYAELNKMSDEELKEFGLHRSDLEDMAWQSVTQSYR